MKKALSIQERRERRFGYVTGAVLSAVAGWVFLLSLGDGLARVSYDLPFHWIRGEFPTNLVMVYIDSNVKSDMRLPPGDPIPRQYHAQLIDRLSKDGARLVLYDILFDEAGSDPVADERLAQAMRANGRVVLVADYVKQMSGNFLTEAPLPPLKIFADAAAGWGLAKVERDPDFGIRRLDGGAEQFPSAGWTAAALLGAASTKGSSARLKERWLNYYCPPAVLLSANFDQALDTNIVRGEFFRDRIVVVGARPEVGVAGDKREEFRTPYSRQNLPDAPGPAIQAFNVLNLLRGDWLTHLGRGKEDLMVILWGVVIASLLMGLRPWYAMGMAVLATGLVAGLVLHLHLHHRIWFSWMVPVAVQTPVALLWSVGYQYAVEGRRRRKLRRAFGAYLSPFMADQISNSEFDLALGGKEVEATVMFTDLESFTKMSESLAPAQVSKILTTYFNQTTRAILDQNGTIIKYIGDAVMAVWGAPVPQKDHAERAVLAAWGMSEAGKKEVEGRRLRTRLGVNSGMVLAGNLGSDFRFDYTLIGDTTNFASRLEGLNKYLGTDVLISESTRKQLSDKIKVRSLGRFIVVGKKTAVGIFEVLGLSSSFPQDPPWLALWNQALDAFVKRNLDEAERLMCEVIISRGGKDGPSDFYLKEIAKARERTDPAEQWDGAVVFDSK